MALFYYFCITKIIPTIATITSRHIIETREQLIKMFEQRGFSFLYIIPIIKAGILKKKAIKPLTFYGIAR